LDGVRHALCGLHDGTGFFGVSSSSVTAWRLLATSTWPGLTWPRSMKARVSSSSYTWALGRVPATSLQKMHSPGGEVSTNMGIEGSFLWMADGFFLRSRWRCR